MTTEGLVDWRGKQINTKKHGGVRAAIFLCFLVVAANTAFVANMMNIVSYVRGTMHMGVASSSTAAANFIGAACMFSLLAAFLSDSYIKRLHTLLIFGPLEILGYGLLALQAHLPSLRPPPCDIDQEPNNCKQVRGFNSFLFYASLYTITLGDGSLRACIPSLGGDQFDGDDPVELKQKISFFNWYTFSIGLGALLGLTFIVWIESNKGWDIGFSLCALLLLVGLLVVTSGSPYYRNQIPTGSPLTRILQVLVAAFKKRKLQFPEHWEETRQMEGADKSGMEVLPRTEDFKFLEKASINNGDTGPWSFCSANQVEETKIIFRMLPIFISSILGYLPVTLLQTFTVQQGSTMNTRLGIIHISPASLFVIPVIFQIVTLVIYDRIIVPFLRRMTGYIGGITHLQRVGIGFIFAVVATSVAALIERRRKKVAFESGLMDSGTGVPMSVFWLGGQFFLLGVMDVTSFVGLLEFFYSETALGMKSIGASMFYCILGLSSWLGSLMIQVVNGATRERGGGRGWLDGSNLNKNKLDLFYWLLSVVGLVSLVNYGYWARRYVYRHNPRMEGSDDQKSSPEREVAVI